MDVERLIIILSVHKLSEINGVIFRLKISMEEVVESLALPWAFIWFNFFYMNLDSIYARLCTNYYTRFLYRKSLSKSKRVIETPNMKSVLFTNSNNISFSTKWNKRTRMSHFIDIQSQTRTSRIRVIFYLELPARIHLWIQGCSFHLRDSVRVSLQNG